MEKKAYKFFIQESLIQTAPQYTESINRGGWINFGEDNLYPDYLIWLMNNSAKHNAILKTKSSMIAGNGFNREGLDATAINFIYNPYNDLNLDDIVYRNAYDLEVFGAFALEVIYSKDKARIAEINYIPVNKVRLSEDGKDVYFSNDWSRLRKFAPIKITSLDLKNPTSKQILYFKEYRPGVEFYGQPGYLGCVNWIELEYKISQWHLNQVDNGFAPSTIVSFNNGIPSDDEMGDIVKQMKNDFEGAKNAGKPMFLFSDGKDRAPEILPFNLNASDEKFIQLNKEITEGVLTGHEVTNPIIFGVAQEGKLGSSTEMVEGIEVFQGKYVNPKQSLIERVYNRLLAFNGSQSKLELNKYQIDIKKIDGEDESSINK